MNTYGPFERYTEVDTEWGTFGVHPGQEVVIDHAGVHPVGEATEQPGPDPHAVPEGNIEEVLAWVGDDLDRAVRAHEAESEARHPRTTLLSALEDLIGGDDAETETTGGDEADEGDEAEAPQDDADEDS